MKRTGSKLAFFGILYFLQGAVFAYAVNFQKPYLAQHGISKDGLGLLSSLLLLPFILKVGLGALSDRLPIGTLGSRKPYMVIGLVLFSACYFGVSQVDPGVQFGLFAAFSWFASLGLALFDTCADGWAIDVASDAEQSSIQGAMVGGRSLGLIMMSLGFGWLAGHFGFSIIFQSLAGMSLLVLLLVVSVKHGSVPARSNAGGGAHDWKSLLKPAYLVFALYGVLYSMASFGTDGLLTLHLSEVHMYSTAQIGVFGLFRGFGALAGAAAFGWLALRYPRSKVLGLGLLLLSGGALLPLFDIDRSAAGSLWGFAWGFQETAFVTVAMSFAQGPWAATFFAISMIFSNVGTALGEAVAAPSAGRFGYGPVFMGFSALALMLLLLIPKLRERRN